MKTPKRLRGNWLLTIPLAGLTILYVVVFDLPARRASRALRDELQASQDFVAGGPLIMAQINDAQMQLQQADGFAAVWRDTAPAGTGSAVLLGEISRLSRDSGTHTIRLEPATGIEHEELRRMPLTLLCVGSFEEIFRLLRGIEALPHSVWIDDLRIERKDAKQADLQCELRLVAFTDKSKISD